MNTPELTNPWDYQHLSPAQRQAYDHTLDQLAGDVKQARAVRDYIRDEEFYASSNSPLQAVMAAVYERKVGAGEMPPRPTTTAPARA